MIAARREADRQPVLEAARDGCSGRCRRARALMLPSVSPKRERQSAAHLGVDVGRREAVGVEPGERPEDGRQRARRAVRVAGGVEVGALPPQQRERHAR